MNLRYYIKVAVLMLLYGNITMNNDDNFGWQDLYFNYLSVLIFLVGKNFY